MYGGRISFRPDVGTCKSGGDSHCSGRWRREIDMVINVAALKDKLYDVVLEDIKEVKKHAAARF